VPRLEYDVIDELAVTGKFIVNVDAPEKLADVPNRNVARKITSLPTCK
jgi:hypothetical protein